MNQRFDVPVTIADSQAALATTLPRMQRASVIALDTEFLREDTYYPQLCLMQIATGDEVFLIDNLAINDLSPLWEILTDPGRIKILHSARQDLELLLELCGTVLQPVFDTQIAAALLGQDLQLGYAALVEDRIGVALSKSQTRTRWCARPLTTAQLDYAVEDVLHLHRLKDLLESELNTHSRTSWFTDDCAELRDPALYRQPADKAWQRIKGAGKLTADGLRRLASLAAWRERTAQKEDRPRQWIVKDSLLIRLAQASDVDLVTLKKDLDLPPGKIRRYGKQLVDASRRLDTDPCYSPAGRPDEAQKALLRELKALAKTTADALGVRPELLAGRRDLQAIAQGQHEGLRVLSGWRHEQLGEALLRAAGSG